MPSTLATPIPPTVALPTLTPTPARQFSLWLSPALPAKLVNDFSDNLAKNGGLPEGIQLANESSSATLSVEVSPTGQSSWQVFDSSQWVYALVTPFPTILDGVSQDDLLNFWRGQSPGPFSGKPLLMEQTTYDAIRSLWGDPVSQAVSVLAGDQILDSAWDSQPSWAIVPFKSLEPHWKVLTIDGQSPIHKDFDPAAYPLVVTYALETPGQAGGILPNDQVINALAEMLPATNRDPSLMTVVVMTGVTALTRATAYEMEIKGITYPGKDIVDWLSSADIAHTSNEVSFYDDCPYPDPNQVGLSFCSRPKYFQLLEYVGIDVVELTGNHNNDVRMQYNVDAWNPSADLYDQNGMAYFGGGRNLQASMQAATFENNGNKIAFIGCNSAGPTSAWATADRPGAAPCQDWTWIKQQITSLNQAGYLVVATVQYDEDYTDKPTYLMGKLFRALVDAGATIVDGSQAHTPKSMELYGSGFIHYGLGNLFFDQMNFPTNGGDSVAATRQEFIDRHVIYDGRYISTELLTALLEEYARPQPMTAAERTAFLQEIFSVPALPATIP